jgi:peptidoglycan/xylan/chitin deacetylase (PgdA/CDA1 family)
VKNEIVRLNSRARINAVAPGWVNTPLIEGRLDDPEEMWTEAQATVPLRKIAQPEDVARTMAFLASHRAAGHITGECISVDGGMEGRIVWKKDEVTYTAQSSPTNPRVEKISPVIPIPVLTTIVPKRKIQVLLSIDFDAVSGFLGTGASSTNDMAAYSSGYFAGQVGVPRLLKLFKKHNISSQVTWFIPGHSMETFPTETKLILDSGAEIGCHGYAHEGAAQMSEDQEREMIARCVELNNKLTGKKPRGWRAPLYQLREHTVKVLEEYGFLYGKSMFTILHCTNIGILTYRTRYILNTPRFLTLFPPHRATHHTNRFQSPPLSNHLDETTPRALSPNLFHARRTAL